MTREDMEHIMKRDVPDVRVRMRKAHGTFKAGDEIRVTSDQAAILYANGAIEPYLEGGRTVRLCDAVLGLAIAYIMGAVTIVMWLIFKS